MDDKPDAERIAKFYSSLGDCVDLINVIISGEESDLVTTPFKNTEAKKLCVTRQVDSLEIMLTKDYWTSEDMTAVNAAITAGKEYVAS